MSALPDWETPATADDLRWWFDKARAIEWTWAKTYADFAPHWYAVHPRTRDMTIADFVRMGRVVRTFGEPGKFWKRTNFYLFTPDRGHKFWCQWSWPPEPRDARLVNLATTEREYGPQVDFDQRRIEMLRLGNGDLAGSQHRDGTPGPPAPDRPGERGLQARNPG